MRLLGRLSFLRRTPVAVLMSAGMACQLVNAASLLALSRLYQVEAYSHWALWFGVSLLIGSIATLRLDVAIVLPEADDEAEDVFHVTLITIVATTLLGFLALWVGGSKLQSVLGLAELGAWKWLTPVVAAASAAVQAVTSWFTRHKLFERYAWANLLLPSATALAQLTLAFPSHGQAWGLLVGTLMAQLGVASWALWRVRTRRPLRSLRWATVKSVFTRFHVYPLYMTPYSFCGLLRERGLLIILSQFGVGGEIGQLALAQRLMNMPVTLLSSALRPVLFQLSSEGDPARLERAVNQSVSTLLAVGLPITATLWFWGPDVVSFVLGSKWRVAGEYAAWISIPSLVLLISNPLDRLFDRFGKQRLAFFLEIAFTGLTIGTFYGGIYLSGSPLRAVQLQSLALTAYYGMWLAAVYKLSGFSLRPLADALVHAILFLGVACVIFRFCEATAGRTKGLFLSAGLAAATVAILANRFVLRHAEPEGRIPQKEGT